MKKLLTLTFLGATSAAAQQPNIVIIMTDQQSHDMMSCAGNPYLRTPAMDRLAREGYRFEKTYAANPVSQPSRYALFTGHYASDVGLRHNSKNKQECDASHAYDESCGMGYVFRRGGYDAVYAGKTHFYLGSGALGFKRICSDAYDGPAAKAEEFFTSRKGNSKPYIAVFSFLNPHDICMAGGMTGRLDLPELPDEQKVATHRYLTMKDTLTQQEYHSQLPASAANRAPIEGQIPQVSDLCLVAEEFSDDDWNFYSWLYHRLTESVDDQIGRVLAAMDKARAWENTIVVFTSDHGEMNSSHGLCFKNVPFEECQRVPLIFVGRDIPKGYRDSESLVCNGIDLLPTLCDLAGIKAPEGLAGTSLRECLTQQKKLARDYIVTETYNSFQIHDGRHKYTVFEVPDNPEMLTDIEADPLELRNFANSPAYASVRRELRNKLAQNLRQRGLWPLREDLALDTKKLRAKMLKDRQHIKR